MQIRNDNNPLKSIVWLTHIMNGYGDAEKGGFGVDVPVEGNLFAPALNVKCTDRRMVGHLEIKAIFRVWFFEGSAVLENQRSGYQLNSEKKNLGTHLISPMMAYSI